MRGGESVDRSETAVLMLVYQVARTPLGNRHANEALALSEAGFDVGAIKFEWRASEPRRQTMDGVTIETVHFGAFRSKLWTVLALPLLYARMLWRMRRLPADIIYCDHPFLLPLAVAVGTLSHKPVVYDSYELFSLMMIGDEHPWLRSAMERLENALVRFTDYVLVIDTNGDRLRDRFERYGDVEVLYNVPRLQLESGVEEPDDGTLSLAYEMTDREGDEEVALDALAERPTVVYVGGISEDKGAVRGLEAFARLADEFPDAQLVYVGNYKSAATREAVREVLGAHGLEDRYRHLGYLPYEKMLTVLRRADVGLALYQPVGHNPLAGMGQGRKFFTYMQAGVPVVGPDFGDIGAVVEREGCGLLVDSTDPDAVADAIRTLLADPDRAARMGQRGRDAIERRYNWERESEKLIRVFDGLT